MEFIGGGDRKEKLLIAGFKFGLSNKRKNSDMWRCTQYRVIGYEHHSNLKTKIKNNEIIPSYNVSDARPVFPVKTVRGT